MNRDVRIGSIDNIERIYAISDLHTDNISNLDMVQNICTKQKYSSEGNNYGIGPNDAIIIAGDISHELSKLKETLLLIKENLDCQIFFIWGNHEAWIGGSKMDSLGIKTSLQKIEIVKQLCDDLGIHTECKLVGSSYENPAFVVPVESWYDGSLSLAGCEDLCEGFEKWRWVDFIRCVWPDEALMKEMLRKHDDDSKMNDNIPHTKIITRNSGQIPRGLTQVLYNKNQKTINAVRRTYNDLIYKNKLPGDEFIEESNDNYNGSKNDSNNIPGLITYSHFLPNQKTLPDWKEPNNETFQRDKWLDHPVPDVSAKFAKVAGSILIDEQIRNIIPKQSSHPEVQQRIQHLHVFGHSHRPKDFVYDDIRYIHNPLGKEAEREMNMVSQDVAFQLIWDCTKQSSQIRNEVLSRNHNVDCKLNYNKKSSTKNISSVGSKHGSWGGEIPGTQVIRYWEEQGGGKKVLARKMKHRKRRRRLEVKRFVKEVELSKNMTSADVGK